MVPHHSPEGRTHIPMGFIGPETIIGDSNLMIPSASLHDFGILTSMMHKMLATHVGRRIQSDFRYSREITYNNFPDPKPLLLR